MSVDTQSLVDELEKIREAVSRGDRNGAIELAIRALGQGLEDPLVLRLVADGLEEDGRLQDAVGLSHRAIVVAPDNVAAWIEFSRRLLAVQLRSESLDAAQVALKLDPGSYDVQIAAAAAFVSLNRFAAAARHAEEATKLCPDAAEPLSTLAIISARLGDFPRAREFAERAIQRRPELPGAEIVLAKVELADNQPRVAIIRLQRLLSDLNLNDGHRAQALTALGDALDIANEPGRAFASYAACNAVMARRAPTQGASTTQPALEPAPAQERYFRGAQRPIDHARMLERYFRRADSALWRTGSGDDESMRDATGHVFLVGFPRSGTTLLENALASHPGIVALEEGDALQLCANDLMSDEKGLDRLADLGVHESNLCRETYWRRVRELVGEPMAGKVFIDKAPISTIALPLIAKLFPSAKILFARRDPRDVTLSCYRRLFGINAVVAEFLTLDGAARYYDQVMRLARLYADKLALPILVVRHEDVVSDFDGEIRKALAFIGLGWRPEVRDFAGRAINARTPSATQLALGLDAKGVGAWRRFERQMAPVLPILAPWAERFGYPAADPQAAPAAPDPRFEPVRLEIGRALQAGDWPSVFARTTEAFGNGFNDPLLFRLRGIYGQQEGHLTAAIGDFETALAGAPGDIGLLSALGLCLARSGRPAEGLARLDEAIALQPNFAPAQFNRGFALELLGDLRSAGEAYVRTLALDPEHANAMGALAMLAARAGDWETAKARARQALRVDPTQPAAIMAMVDVEVALGQLREAERRIRTLLQTSRPTNHERAVSSQRLGDILDRRGRYSEAFVAYNAAATGLRAVFLPRFETSREETASVLAERLIGYFAGAQTSTPHPVQGAPPGGDRHIFLLGFPRSGSTMTGQVLARHPDVMTLDEKDPLAEATQHFLRGAGGLDSLAKLNPDEAAHWRGLYWRRVRAVGCEPKGKLFVDKLPMNTLGLPLIAKLFPQAGILFMRRDPRDVVLSCFRRQFVINPTTVDLLTLEGAARLYDLTMRLMTIYEAEFDGRLRVQSYETLVAEFEPETRAICAFVGIPWRADLADFAKGAGDVATPSSSQIAAGLTDQGIGHWRFYRDQMAGVLPILEPWVERFGYQTS